jgi:hypothetical protein
MAFSAISGWRVTSWYYQAEIAQERSERLLEASKAQDVARKLEVMALELSGVVSERDAFRHREIRTVERVVNRDIIKLVQGPAPRCDLDPEWVRIHDKSAAGVSQDTDPSPSVIDPARVVTDIDALSTIATNYAICQDTRATLISLQEWASSLKGLQ